MYEIQINGIRHERNFGILRKISYVDPAIYRIKIQTVRFFSQALPKNISHLTYCALYCDVDTPPMKRWNLYVPSLESGQISDGGKTLM